MSASRPRVLFYVQHLLGIGHLKRAATLTRAIEDAGLAVTLVAGGHPVPGLDFGNAQFVQLPPIRAVDKYFKVLVDARGEAIDDGFKEQRRRRLLRTFETVRPDLVVTELFPFGRRQLRFEIIPLLDAARAAKPPARVVCSVRDILVTSPKPERLSEMLDLVQRYYDLVLVHGDPKLIRFEETFPLARHIASRIRYTGYVVEPPAPKGSANSAGLGEVIVSAGGGAVSEALLRAAIAARPMTRLKRSTWRVLAGYALPEEVFQSVRADAPQGVVVERVRADFTTLLANCALSISQGGYNTVMEVLAAGTRGVIVPYAGGLESEQTLRSRLLSARGALQVVPETDIDPETIARAAEAALNDSPASAAGLDTSGAETSARILAELAAARVSP